MFESLSWYKIVVTLQTKHANHLNITALQAIFKGAWMDLFPDFQWQKEGGAPLVFHILNRRWNVRLKQNTSVLAEIIICRGTLETAGEYAKALEQRMAVFENSKYYTLVKVDSITQRTFKQLKKEIGELPLSGELTLDFKTPYNLKRVQGKHRSYIDADIFIKQLENRFERLFGKNNSYRGEKRFEIIPSYWRYTRVTDHKSYSNRGTTQSIEGYVNHLFFKGDFSKLLPFLILAKELHAGSKLSFSYGYFDILIKPQRYFDRFFPNKQALIAIVEECSEKYDSATDYVAKEIPIPTSVDIYCEKIVDDIENDTFIFSPNNSFDIKKKDGTKRFVEQLDFKDFVVEKYLQRTINKIFDCFFEEESIGFRKGISRLHSEKMINDALSGGYRWIVESDIESFFPSINHDTLFKLLDKYLPGGDTVMKRVLKSVVKRSFVKDNVVFERHVGVAQGSPLSPLLANLYLDDFDEYIKESNVKFVRYADDFVILAKSKADAEAILAKTETFLEEIGLHIKWNKTGIKNIKEGFEFLGISFREDGAQIEDTVSSKLLKKPLYITQPYLFLAVNGESIDISKNRRVIDSFPFRRLSEIIIMDKVLHSSALTRKCVEMGIPLTTTLKNGYFVATVTPDSKKYFEVAYLHGKKFNELSETEITTFAKELVVGKIKNYISLFKGKYHPGMSLLIHKLEKSILQIEGAGSISVVRGIEGNSARDVFQNLNLLINNPVFHIKKRERRPPDRINSLLNFGYYLLFTRINTTIRAIGLNPYLGFLHSSEDRYESLVADIQELYRAEIDKFLVRVINLNIIKESDFIESNNGFFLTGTGKAKFIEKFETRMVELKGKFSLSDRIYFQISVIKKWAKSEGSFYLFDKGRL